MFEFFGVGVNLSPFSKSFISVLFNVRDDKFTIWTSACSVAGFAIGFCMGFGLGTKIRNVSVLIKAPIFGPSVLGVWLWILRVPVVCWIFTVLLSLCVLVLYFSKSWDWWIV